MSEQVKFEGWRAMNGDSVKGNFSWGEYEPKPFDEDDIDIKIHYCGLVSLFRLSRSNFPVVLTLRLRSAGKRCAVLRFD